MNKLDMHLNQDVVCMHIYIFAIFTIETTNLPLEFNSQA